MGTGYTYHPHMTPGRLAWLERLERESIAQRNTNVGFQCMKLGWTEWAYEARDGERIGYAEFHRRWPAATDAEARAKAAAYDTHKIIGEQLTDAGRAALAQHRSDQ